ncbi:hypothetical protein D3C84_745100 [compost metagenome]
MTRHGVVRVHGLGLLRVQRRRVDTDQAHAETGEQVDGVFADRGEFGVPASQRRLLISTQQDAFGQVGQTTVQLPGLHQCVAAQAMQDPARPDIHIERNIADGRTVLAVMQRRVDMGAGVRRQRDASDIHRAFRPQRPDAFFLKRRISRPGRCCGTQGRADVPPRHCFFHCTALGLFRSE